jgi:hypothetical protein
MSTLTVTIASVFIVVSASCAVWMFAQIRALKRRCGDSASWQVAGRGIILRCFLGSVLYGVWVLVKSATSSSSAAAWLVVGIMAAILVWCLWDFVVWLRPLIRRRAPTR